MHRTTASHDAECCPSGQVALRRSFVTTMATIVLFAGLVAGQATNPRFGKWKLKQDAPPPANNIMTYEPYSDGGMKVTVDSVNANGRETHWTYVTMFDGKDMPVTGNTNNDTTAVRKIDDRTNEITSKKAGKVTQVIINVLSEDGKTIENTYKNYNAQGEQTTTTHATYIKQ